MFLLCCSRRQRGVWWAETPVTLGRTAIGWPERSNWIRERILASERRWSVASKSKPLSCKYSISPSLITLDSRLWIHRLRKEEKETLRLMRLLSSLYGHPDLKQGAVTRRRNVMYWIIIISKNLWRWEKSTEIIRNTLSTFGSRAGKLLFPCSVSNADMLHCLECTFFLFGSLVS